MLDTVGRWRDVIDWHWREVLYVIEPLRSCGGGYATVVLAMCYPRHKSGFRTRQPAGGSKQQRLHGVWNRDGAVKGLLMA